MGPGPGAANSRGILLSARSFLSGDGPDPFLSHAHPPRSGGGLLCEVQPPHHTLQFLTGMDGISGISALALGAGRGPADPQGPGPLPAPEPKGGSTGSTMGGVGIYVLPGWAHPTHCGLPGLEGSPLAPEGEVEGEGQTPPGTDTPSSSPFPPSFQSHSLSPAINPSM